MVTRTPDACLPCRQSTQANAASQRSSSGCTSGQLFSMKGLSALNYCPELLWRRHLTIAPHIE